MNNSIDKYLTGGRAIYKTIMKPNTVTLGGKTAYLFQGAISPTYHDFQLVFANGFTYTFDNSAKAISAADSSINTENITKVYNNLLQTVTFQK